MNHDSRGRRLRTKAGICCYNMYVYCVMRMLHKIDNITLKIWQEANQKITCECHAFLPRYHTTTLLLGNS